MYSLYLSLTLEFFKFLGASKMLYAHLPYNLSRVKWIYKKTQNQLHR